MAYKKKTTLAEEYDINVRTVDRVIDLIRDQLGKRYRRDVLIQTGRLLRVDEDVFKDAIVNRDLIVRGIAPKYKKYAV